MNYFKDKWLTLIICINIFLLFPTVVSADGILISHEREDIYQPSQKAIIVFDNETEQLIIQSKYEGNITDFGWIVPLPSYPKVENANELLFMAFHEITFPENYVASNDLFDLMNEGSKIEVLEKVQIGPYDVSILSANDSDSLLEWLKNNRYNFLDKKNAGEILDYYIKNKWFFVAIKVDVIRNKNEIVNKYRAIDERISNVNNLVKFISEDTFEDIKEKKTYEDSFFRKLNFDITIYNGYLEKYWIDYNIDLSIHNYVVNEMSGYRSSEEVLITYKNIGYDSSNISQLENLLVDSIYDDLNHNRSYEKSRFNIISLKSNNTEKIRKYNELNIQYFDYLNMDFAIKSLIEKDISNLVNPEIYSIEKKLKSGTIEPIKMTFATNEIIYPLKISSLGNRDMEILLYTLTDSKTQAKNFSLEYANWIYPNITNATSSTSSFLSLGTLINKKYFLTKLRANLTENQMSNDLLIHNADDNSPYRMKIERHSWQISFYEILHNFLKAIQRVRESFN